MNTMQNFTVGPVMSDPNILAIGAEQVPYFRTQEFSRIMLENESLVKRFAKAKDTARAVFITGSGTASMEASVINVLSTDDKALVINGGSFGERFVQMLELHSIPHTVITPQIGHGISYSDLSQYENQGYTAFLVNLDETSTGVLYDIDLISGFCKRNKLLLMVDAISSFLCDDINMEEHAIDVLIAGSQKALACPPGISLIVLSQEAQKRVLANKSVCMYLDLKLALSNGERGQTPFTCAVGTLLQINARLKQIEKDGGIDAERERIAHIATDFRNKIKDLPFEIVSSSLSNCVTPLHPLTASANDIFLVLKDEYSIWVCPNGGDLKDKVFRVGHIGALTTKDNDTLIAALKDLQRRNII